MRTKQNRAYVLSCFCHVQLFVTLWTVARHTPVSMGFSKHEYWSGLPCPPPKDLPDPGIQPASLMSPALAGSFFTTSATWEAQGTGDWSPTWEERGMACGTNSVPRMAIGVMGLREWALSRSEDAKLELASPRSGRGVQDRAGKGRTSLPP